jgi:hypothetical protein
MGSWALANEAWLAFHFWILRQQTADKDDPDRPVAQIVLTHLDEYWGHILREEYLLVPNLENETYLQLVLDGTLESLPAKLAHSSHNAGSFDAWRRRRRPRLLGEPPRRLLREGDFIEHLLEACIDYCQFHPPRMTDPAAPARYTQLPCQPNFGTIGAGPAGGGVRCGKGTKTGANQLALTSAN